MVTYPLSGHVAPLSAFDQLSVQQIANALAGAGLHAVRLRELQTAAMLNALDQCQGNRTYAARILGISARTLQRKLKTLNGAGLNNMPEPAAASLTLLTLSGSP